MACALGRDIGAAGLEGVVIDDTRAALATAVRPRSPARLAETTIVPPGIAKDAGSDSMANWPLREFLFAQALFSFLEEEVAGPTAWHARCDTTARRYENLE